MHFCLGDLCFGSGIGIEYDERVDCSTYFTIRALLLLRILIFFVFFIFFNEVNFKVKVNSYFRLLRLTGRENYHGRKWIICFLVDRKEVTE